MITRYRRLACALSVVALTACGTVARPAATPTPRSSQTAPPPTDAPSASPTSTPLTGPAILDEVNVHGATELEIRNLSGAVAGSIQLTLQQSIDDQQYGAGPHHVWILDSTQDSSSLDLYAPSGALLVSDLYTPSNWSFGPLFTADGSMWVWPRRTGWNPSPAPPSTTTFYVGTQAQQMTPILTHTESQQGFNLSPVAWVGSKVYLTEVQTIGGGLSSLNTGRGVWVLDPGTRSLIQVNSSCALVDVGSDGSLICEEGKTLVIERPSGDTLRISVPGSFTGVSAGFSPDGASIMVMTEDVNDPHCALFVGSSTSGALTTVPGGCSGLWLPNGGIVVNMADGGVEVVPPHGEPTRIQLTVPAGDTFVGVIGIIPDPRD